MVADAALFTLGEAEELSKVAVGKWCYTLRKSCAGNMLCCTCFLAAASCGGDEDCVCSLPELLCGVCASSSACVSCGIINPCASCKAASIAIAACTVCGKCSPPASTCTTCANDAASGERR